MNVRLMGFGLSFCVATSLAGCAGVVPGFGGGGTAPAARTTLASGDLLYVAQNVGARIHRHGVVSVLTFPQGKPVARITGIGFPRGICADATGNVWVISYPTRQPIAYEFAHGGTKPIAQIALPEKSFAGGCAVDPTSGDLAIANDDSALRGDMFVYPGAKSGQRLIYRTPFEPLWCTYDGSGDLLADGIVGSTAFFVLGELPKGHKRFKQIDLNVRTGFPGGLQWDGQYVAVETGEGAWTRIYRLQSSPSGVQVAQTVRVEDMYPETPIGIDNGEVAAKGGRSGGQLRLWPYPSGGQATATLGRFREVQGLAISRASN